jgi:hypothetical protein
MEEEPRMAFSASSFFAGVGTVGLMVAAGFGGGIVLSQSMLDGKPRELSKVERQAAERQAEPLFTPTPVVVKPAQANAAPTTPGVEAAATPPGKIEDTTAAAKATETKPRETVDLREAANNPEAAKAEEKAHKSSERRKTAKERRKQRKEERRLARERERERRLAAEAAREPGDWNGDDAPLRVRGDEDGRRPRRVVVINDNDDANTGLAFRRQERLDQREEKSFFGLDFGGR